MKKLFAAIIALAALAGCSKEKNENRISGDVPFIGKMTVVYRGENVVTDNVMVDFCTEGEAEGTATLKMYQVKFVPQMPMSLDINIHDVKYTVSGEVVSFNADGVVPLPRRPSRIEAELPAEMYTVRGLAGTIRGGVLEFSLSFGDFPTSYKGETLKLE